MVLHTAGLQARGPFRRRAGNTIPALPADMVCGLSREVSVEVTPRVSLGLNSEGGENLSYHLPRGVDHEVDGDAAVGQVEHDPAKIHVQCGPVTGDLDRCKLRPSADSRH